MFLKSLDSFCIKLIRASSSFYSFEKVFNKNSFIQQINNFGNFRLLSTSKCLSFNKTVVNQNDEKEKSKVRKVRIYTRTGDSGTSSLFTGERRPKNDLVFEALGNTDELNSAIGLAREFCLEMSSNKIDKEKLNEASKKLQSRLIYIQSTLLNIGSHIATPKTRASPKQIERLHNFDDKLTKEIESWIDDYESELEPIRNFILPSGGKCASTLHLSRSICRRLERSLQPLLHSKELESSVVAYINRLSDFLFVAARYASMKEGKEETIFKKQL